MIPCFSLTRADDKYNPAFALPFRKQWILNLSTGMRTSKKLIDTFAKFRNRSTEKVNKRGFCNDSAPLPAGSAGTGLDTSDSDNVQSIIEELQAKHGLDFDVRSARESLQRTQFLEEDLSILMNGPFARLSQSTRSEVDILPPAMLSLAPGGLPNSHYIDVEHNLRSWDGTPDPASVQMHDEESSAAAVGGADDLPDISGITLNAEQQKGLDLVMSATRPDAAAGDQLLLFFHGSPGTGKTVLSRVMYVTISQMFEGQPIRCCASTGVAAAEQILGCTPHSAAIWNELQEAVSWRPTGFTFALQGSEIPFRGRGQHGRWM